MSSNMQKLSADIEKGDKYFEYKHFHDTFIACSSFSFKKSSPGQVLVN